MDIGQATTLGMSPPRNLSTSHAHIGSTYYALRCTKGKGKALCDEPGAIKRRDMKNAASPSLLSPLCHSPILPLYCIVGIAGHQRLISASLVPRNVHRLTMTLTNAFPVLHPQRQVNNMVCMLVQQPPASAYLRLLRTYVAVALATESTH